MLDFRPKHAWSLSYRCPHTPHKVGNEHKLESLVEGSRIRDSEKHRVADLLQTTSTSNHTPTPENKSGCELSRNTLYTPSDMC